MQEHVLFQFRTSSVGITMSGNNWEQVSFLLMQLLQGKLDLDNSEDDAQRDSQDSHDEILRALLSKLRALCVRVVNISYFVSDRRLSVEEAEELAEYLSEVNSCLEKYQE